MKKIFRLILLVLLFSNCSNDDVGIDCALFDPAFPNLYLRIVDNTGANLIENGTIDPNNITVEGDFSGAGFRFIPADEFANPDSEIREFDNTLNLFIPYESTFQYSINLDDYETINVNFKAEHTKIPCDLSYYKPIEAEFKDDKLELKEIPPLQYIVVVEL